MADQQATPQPFAILPSSFPPLTVPTAVPSPTSYIYTLPTARSFSHIAVFLLPGIELPPNTAAAVYISLPSTAAQPAGVDFKFLGGIGPGKESAVFKISGLLEGNAGGPQGMGGGGMPEITIGISIESAEEVGAKMSALTSTNANTNSATSTSTALVPHGASSSVSAPPNQADTVKLAQKIIKNAFNFLASFSGNTANGVEVVPLKAFEGWWRKFEGRIVNDPAFLTREED